MHRKILIPTDFSIESLLPAKHAIFNLEFKRLDIILFYCTPLSDSITDLLFYSKSKITSALLSDDFNEACHILENKFSSKTVVFQTEVFHGKNNSAFKNFTEAKAVSEIYLLKDYVFQFKKGGIDPLPFIRSSDLKISEIDWLEQTNIAERDKLITLFSI